MASIASLKRISAKDLSERILAERDNAEPTYAIVDVRDDGKLFGGCCKILPAKVSFPMRLI